MIKELEKLPGLKWHRFEVVPYDAEKHPWVFDPEEDPADERPDFVWEGECPEFCEDGLLVARKNGDIVWSEGFDPDFNEFDRVPGNDVAYWAYPTWSENVQDN